MVSQTKWLPILNECRDKVKEQVDAYFKTLTLTEPQPSLGTGAGGDPIKQVDLAAEKAIVETLEGHGVSFTLISEESGVKRFGKAPDDCYVTIDPIDGTTNLIRRVPFYATSIAVSRKPFLSNVHAALITDLFHGTTYTAEKNKGAFRDGEKIAPSKNGLLEDAVVGLDLNGYKVERIAPLLTDLIKRMKHIRHFGANALELCYVADGTTDAFIDVRGKLRTTDVAAARLIVREAGGRITTPSGEPLDAILDPKQTVEFIAANKEIHPIILRIIKQKKETK